VNMYDVWCALFADFSFSFSEFIARATPASWTREAVAPRNIGKMSSWVVL